MYSLISTKQNINYCDCLVVNHLMRYVKKIFIAIKLPIILYRDYLNYY